MKRYLCYVALLGVCLMPDWASAYPPCWSPQPCYGYGYAPIYPAPYYYYATPGYYAPPAIAVYEYPAYPAVVIRQPAPAPSVAPRVVPPATATAPPQPMPVETKQADPVTLIPKPVPPVAEPLGPPTQFTAPVPATGTIIPSAPLPVQPASGTTILPAAYPMAPMPTFPTTAIPTPAPASAPPPLPTMPVPAIAPMSVPAPTPTPPAGKLPPLELPPPSLDSAKPLAPTPAPNAAKIPAPEIGLGPLPIAPSKGPTGTTGHLPPLTLPPEGPAAPGGVESISRSSPLAGGAATGLKVRVFPALGTAAGSMKVGFYNRSERDLNLEIEGRSVKLPRKSYLHATIPATFRWKYDNQAAQTATVPAGAVGLDVTFE